jgi:hypothetical protein
MSTPTNADPERAPAAETICAVCGKPDTEHVVACEPPSQPPADAHDWTEDFAHENGRYQNKCANCGTVFIGHKRRVCCKVCALQDKSVATADAPFTQAAKTVLDSGVADKVMGEVRADAQVDLARAALSAKEST